MLDDTVNFVSERVLADGPGLKPAYRVTGDILPEEHDVDLPGYPGGAVKLGNSVTNQFQLDAYGEALLLLAAAGQLDRLESSHWRAAQRWYTPSSSGGASSTPEYGRRETGAGRIHG